MSEQHYVQPPYHFRYPRPYVPGPIKGTKKEWRICCECQVLFLVKIKNKLHVTCGDSKCVQKHINYNTKHNWKKHKKQRTEYMRRWRKRLKDHNNTYI